MEFEPIRVEPAYRRVASALLQRITAKSLAMGQRLPSETELARQFGVNRSTVREAMRELESAGLIRRERGSKLMVVSKPEHQVVAGGIGLALAMHNVTYFDVWEALTILEPSLAEVAAKRRTAVDLQNLQAVVQQTSMQVADSVQAVKHVANFFRRLGEATHNPALMLAQEPLIQLLMPSLRAMIDRAPQARERIAIAETRICEAVESRSAQEAKTWMARHLRDFKKGYEIAEISLYQLVEAQSRS